MTLTYCEHHLPDFLCRRCCPELVTTEAQRAEEITMERRRREAENEDLRRRDQRLRIQQRIASMTMHGEPTGISGTVVAALRRKAERLAA